MQALVDAMNGTGWIQTQAADYDTPCGVVFYCKASHVRTLCRLLNRAEVLIGPGYYRTELMLVHSMDSPANQQRAPVGWLALDVRLSECTPEQRMRMLSILTVGFMGEAPGSRKVQTTRRTPRPAGSRQ